MTYKDKAFYWFSPPCIRDRQWNNISWCHNIFCERATNHRALLWKMTYKEKAFYGSSSSFIRDRQSTHAQLTYTHTSNPQTHSWHTCSLKHIHAHELQWHNIFWCQSTHGGDRISNNYDCQTNALKIITTAKICNKFSRESPYISNTCSREPSKFPKPFQLSKQSPRLSKDLWGKLIDLEIQIFYVWSPQWVEHSIRASSKATRLFCMER